MPTFSMFGQSLDIPAIAQHPKAITRDESAWQGHCYLTIRLTAAMEALRVHTKGKDFPGRKASPEAGAWVLIGDVIQTSSELANSRSLPTNNPHSMTAFTHVSEANLFAGCVLNIGIASAKFGGSGGGFQAEYVSGPPIQFKSLVDRHWHGRAGNA